MKRFIILFSSFFFLSSLFAQKNYLPGSITKISGETIQGFIDYRVWELNPSEISFRTTIDGAVSAYTVADLLSFEVTGKDKYIRAEVTEDMKPVKMSELNIIPANLTTNTTVFLRELFRNERIGLYMLRDFKFHFYVQNGNGKFDELAYIVEFTNDNTSITSRPIFQNQLLTYFPEERSNADVVAALAKLKYTEKDLTGFFYYITKTTPKKREKIKPVFFAGTGVALSSISVTGQTKIADHSIKSSTTPLFFIGGDFYTRRRIPVFMRLQMQYYTTKYQTSYMRPYGGYTAEDERYSLKMSAIKASMGFLYQLWKSEKNGAYAGVELSGNFSSYKGNVLTLRDTTAGTTRIENNALSFERTWFGIHALAGFQLNNKFDISAVGKIMGSFSNMYLVSVKPTLYEIKIGYRL